MLYEELLDTSRLRILHLEDDAADAELIHQALKADTRPARVERVATRAAFEAALRSGEFDLVLSDYSLPGFDGPAALAIARSLAPDVPFIIVSGAVNEDTAVRLMRSGATDYVFKDRLRRLGPAIHQAMREARERTARREAERLMQLQVERMALLAEAAQRFAEAGPAYPAVLSVVVRHVADLLGDACTLRLRSEDEQWLTVAADWHPNPDTLAFLHSLAARPVPAEGPSIVSRVLSTGHPQLVPVVAAADVHQLISEAWWPYWERCGAHSLLAVPLRSRQRVIGVLVATRDETPASYTEDDQHLLSGLADRAALTIENARLYEAAQTAWGAAQVAAERAAQLQEITALLAAALTPDQVGNIIVNEGAAVLGTNTATLQLLSPNGDLLRVVNASRSHPLVQARRRTIHMSEPMPSADVVRTGKARWFPSQADVVARYPGMAEGRLVTGFEALAVLPMTVENRPIGTLAINFPQERTFSHEEQAFMLTLAGLCAQALERARLYAAEATARDNAEQAVERTARLQQVTAALAKALTPRQVTAVVIEHGVAASSAAAGLVALVDREAGTLMVEHAAGYSQAALEEFGTIPLEAPIPMAEVARSGEAVWIESAADLASRYPLVAAAHSALGHGAAAAVPVSLARETAAVLVLSFAGPRTFDAQEKALILALAQQCAQALERARLYVEVQEHAAGLEQRVRERTEQLRALTARLESLREDERSRIAREVHDELGGAMTAIKMDLSRLGRRGPGVEGDPAEAERAEALAGTMRLIDDTIQTVRRIATDLRPALLDDFGLVAAVEWQLQEFGRRTGIRCEAELEVETVDLDSQTATALFRVIQETLTNVARHAEATLVTLRLERRPDCLVLSVRDNGSGFRPEELARKNTLGMAGMRERVFAIAGELDIQSAPGKGTTVTVIVPGPTQA